MNLCGFTSLEHFKKHTAFLAEQGAVHLLQAAADELATKLAPILEAEEAYYADMHLRWLEEQDQTKGV